MNPELMKLARRSKGVRCPSCNHNVKVYKRNFNSGMAKALIYLYLEARRTNNKWLKFGRYLKQYQWPADYAKLVWWGLVEKHSGKAKDGNSNGLYRITRKGARFAKRQITVPKYAIEYMSKVEKFEGIEIDIVDAAGDEFDYNELMRRPAYEC